ncbi:hypothetical protein CORC01_01345 [Colletotrichum orchidophilum]|uniref:Uncharacterized protein n=1 Tax=Colletotrichum orchidophilum TaxID=1209926 RepID=A0A1G4BPA3_9PEZI|nr:uncharacterized protein CORC01_01345 [Colletotrichum orchidophilum]OHF03292.1 hypothetical protein CORC01_01345 [Colletotrichum orchidophilum]
MLLGGFQATPFIFPPSLSANSFQVFSSWVMLIVVMAATTACDSLQIPGSSCLSEAVTVSIYQGLQFADHCVKFGRMGELEETE